MWRLLIWSSVLGLLPAGPAAAAFVNENLITTMPSGYEVGFQDRSNKAQIAEWVPKGETVENWTELVTIQVFHGLEAAPDGFMRDLEKRWINGCPGAEKAHVIADAPENGYPTLVWLLHCPQNPETGKPETTWFKAVRGNDSFYLVQKAFRFAPSKEQIGQWRGFLKAVHVCDARLPDRPCPQAKE